MIFNTQLELNARSVEDLEQVYFHVFDCTEFPAQTSEPELKELILALASTGLLIDHDRVQHILQIEDWHHPVIKQLYTTLYMAVDANIPKAQGIAFNGTVRDPNQVFGELEQQQITQSLRLKDNNKTQKQSKML